MAALAKHFYDDDEGDDDFYSAEEDPWGKGCSGAPWWVEPYVEDQWREYLERMWTESSSTHDAASLSSHDNQLVFVYGTLKKGFGLHELLHRSKFIDRVWTKSPAFKLVQTASFPAAIMGAGGPLYKAIQGELYLVPTVDIKHLDQCENNGSLFHRRRTGVEFDDGTSALAWMYIADSKKFESVTKLCPSFTRKKNGVHYYSYTQAIGKAK